MQTNKQTNKIRGGVAFKQSNICITYYIYYEPFTIFQSENIKIKLQICQLNKGRVERCEVNFEMRLTTI